jgi:hypothetical protein
MAPSATPRFFLFFLFHLFMDRVLAVQPPPPIFAKHLIFWNQSSHVENQTEPSGRDEH